MAQNTLDKTISVILRPIMKSDANEILQLWSDYGATLLTNWPYITSLEECQSQLDRVIEYYANPLHTGAFAIESQSLGFLGIIGGDVVDADSGIHVAWYFLKSDVRKQGIAKQALNELLKIMKDSGKVKIVTATAVTQNVASWKVLEFHQFKRQGIIKNGHTKHGQSLDLYQYCLIL